MSIPLVKKLDLDSVNTTIIAIKRLLQQAGVSEGGNTIINNNSDGGIPLGTWASFENDSAPNGEWLQGGTSFNPNTYPALAMMLGGNVVPIMYDHNRLGSIETIVESQSYQNYTINSVEYDGFLYVSKNCGGAQSWYVYINGQQINKNYDANSSNWETSITVPVKKGDKVEIKADANRALWLYAQYYKHPLFIKATPTSADSDYEGTLNAIREFYVRNNTYSTEERLTGGVWIDGKPIYRKATTTPISMSTSWSTINLASVMGLNTVERIINADVFFHFNSDTYTATSKETLKEVHVLSTSTCEVMTTNRSLTSDIFIIEYTKTTD